MEAPSSTDGRSSTRAGISARVTDAVRRRFIDVRPEERRGLGWSFLAFFCLLSAYYILRPLREARAQGLGVQYLPWLYGATFACMLLLHPLWSALVSRLPRRRLIPVAFRFFATNLVVFFLVLRGRGPAGAQDAGWFTQAAFFVWASVFSLMAVAIFWSFMTDLWNTDQAKRLFGIVSLGGSLGAICGPLLTAVLVRYLPPTVLLLVAVLLLEASTQCLRAVARAATTASAGLAPSPAVDASATREDDPVGGGVLSGLAPPLRSRYLAAAAGFLALGVVSATFNIYLQAHLVSATGQRDQAVLTGLFARLDLAANLLTAVAQGLVAAPLLSRFGTLPILLSLPLLSVVAFGAAAVVPSLAIVIPAMILRRSIAYGLLVPAYGVLFTLVSREDRYKIRTFIDTVIYRGGDLLGGLAFALLLQLGLGLRGIAVVAATLAVPWLVVAVSLGRMQRRRSQESAEEFRTVLR